MSSAYGDPDQKPFEFSERLGIVFIVQSAGLSAIAVSSLLAYILYSAVKINRGASRNWSTDTHIHYYFLNLLVSDLIQAIGGLLSIRWIVEAGVTQDTQCTVQGMFKQMGDVGVALTSLAIAIHTFSVLVFRRQASPMVAKIVIAGIWLFIILIVGIGYSAHSDQFYYGNTGYWCWITEDFTLERIILEYLWLWLAAVVNIVIYAFLALVVMGFIIVDGGRISVTWGSARRENRILAANGGAEGGAIALQLLFYPLVYIITVAPVAIVRWMAFSGDEIPFAATAFASILFSLSGLFNVILFKATRPKLLPTRSQNNTFTNTYDSHQRYTASSRLANYKDFGDNDDLEPPSWKAGSAVPSWRSGAPTSARRAASPAPFTPRRLPVTIVQEV